MVRDRGQLERAQKMPPCKQIDSEVDFFLMPPAV
jgi:hypothetical protein